MMTFSEALEQYLDARDKLAKLVHRSDFSAGAERHDAIVAMTEAAARMDELMPAGGVAR